MILRRVLESDKPASARQPIATAAMTPVVRFDHSPLGVGLRMRPATIAPSMNAANARAGRSTGMPSAPARPMPKMTTLPVMFPVKTLS